MKLSLIILLAGVAAAGSAGAATSHVESFTGSLNGWTNSGSPAWRATNDCAQVTFAASPAPQTSTLLATGAWASAAFTGNYAEAGLRLLGFRFRAVQVLPSVLTVRWTSGSTGYFRNVQTELTTTGTWHQFYFSLHDKAAGNWDGDPADLFTQVLSGVDTLSITVTKPSTFAASEFQVDDVTLDHLHQASALLPASSTSAWMRWEFLQTNVAYELESAMGPDAGWSSVLTLPATNRQQEVVAPASGDRLLWRLRLP